MWKESVVFSFKVLYQRLPEETVRDHKTSDNTVCIPSLESPEEKSGTFPLESTCSVYTGWPKSQVAL
jgi:hypothetical protein